MEEKVFYLLICAHAIELYVAGHFFFTADHYQKFIVYFRNILQSIMQFKLYYWEPIS